MTSQDARGANRRKLARINTRMRVDLYRRRLFNRWQFVSRTRALDYNRYGIGLICAMRFSPGAVVKLDLYAPNMILRQVKAQVVTCHRAGQGYRIGLRTYDNLRELAGDTDQHQIRYLTGMEHQLDK